MTEEERQFLHIRIRSVRGSDDKEWGIFTQAKRDPGPLNGWWFHSYRLALATMGMLR